MKEITQKDLQPLQNPADGWYIIDSAGDHPSSHLVGGKRVHFVQHLSPEVLGRIAEAGVPAEGLYIDRDHGSLHPSGSSEACGWVRELALCHGNLAARIEWTPLGLPLIQQGIYKHFSTVYPPHEEQMLAGTFTPDRLVGLALVNNPNNADGQPPITNRRQAPLVAAPGNATQTETNTHMENNPKLLAALGLADGATEEEIIAAAESMAARCAAAEEAAVAAADAEAEATIAAAEDKDAVRLTEEEKKEVKEHLIADRPHGQRYLNLLCNSKRAQAAPPRRYGDPRPPAASLVANSRREAEEQEARLNNRAHALCREAAAAGRPVDYATARARAARELNL